MKVTVDYYAFAKVALDEAKPFLAKIRDEGTPAALDILERWEMLERDVESTGALLANEANSEARQALADDLVMILTARKEVIVSAVLAHAGSSLANAMDAALSVAIKVIVGLVAAFLKGAA